MFELVITCAQLSQVLQRLETAPGMTDLNKWEVRKELEKYAPSTCHSANLHNLTFQ